MGGLRWADDRGLDEGYGYGGSSSSGHGGRGYHGSGSRGGRGSRGGGGWGGGRLGGRGRGLRSSHRHSHGSTGSGSGYGDGMGGYHDMGDAAPIGSGMMSDTYVSAQSLQAGRERTWSTITPCISAMPNEPLYSPSSFRVANTIQRIHSSLLIITTVSPCVFDVT